MPSFLSKVFGPRKKQDKDSQDASRRRTTSDPSLLEGKFERVSPNVSPIGDKFPSAVNEKEKNGKKEKGVKNGSTAPETPTQKPDYFLSLNLPSQKNEPRGRPLGVVFEGDGSRLSSSSLERRRLSPQEALVLLRVCSQQIMDHGLDTPGIMHPHWYSASPEAQQRLITLFLQSLASNGPSNTLSVESPSTSSDFQSEISTTRSSHDVAAVLRWGIRHLQLEGSSFGKEQEWYQNFFNAEKSASYPPKAFSEKLVPLVQQPHLDLLNAVLSVLSSLAAHAEANSISGGKLSMLLGLWLLTSQRSESGDDWEQFYNRWEKNGRMLEHLFLSHLRDESATHSLPKRLRELVQHYPYSSHTSSDAGLLPRTRFSTFRYDALFIYVETKSATAVTKRSRSLAKLFETALQADITSDDPETKRLWEVLRQAATTEDGIDVNKVLSDETIQLFAFVDPSTAVSPSFKLDISNGFTRRRSLSLDGRNRPGSPASVASPSRHERSASASGDDALPVPANNDIGMDWSQFSNSGFLDSGLLGAPLAKTLLDKDVEVTQPPSRASSKKVTRDSSKRYSGGRGRKSLDTLPPITIPDVPQTQEAVDESHPISRATRLSLIKLDEAFIDFWSDSLLDPISEGWPRFTICRVKPLAGFELEVVDKPAKSLQWVVIEQKFVKPPPPVPEETPITATATATEPTSPSTPETAARPRPTSPKPSFRSFSSSAKKRFTFWGSSDKDKDKDGDDESEKGKKKRKGSPKIGEMGEIVEDEKASTSAPPPPPPRKEEKEEKNIMATGGAFATGVIAAGAAAGVTSGLIAQDEDKKDGVEVQPTQQVPSEAPAGPAPTSKVEEDDEKVADTSNVLLVASPEGVSAIEETSPAAAAEDIKPQDHVESEVAAAPVQVAEETTPVPIVHETLAASPAPVEPETQVEESSVPPVNPSATADAVSDSVQLPVQPETIAEPLIAADEPLPAPPADVDEPTAKAEELAAPIAVEEPIQPETQVPETEPAPVAVEEFSAVPVEVKAAVGEQVPLAEPELVEEVKEETEAGEPESVVQVEEPPVEAEVKEDATLAVADDPAVAVEDPKVVVEPTGPAAVAEAEDVTPAPVINHEEEAPVEAEVEAAPTALEDFTAAPVEVEAAVDEQVPLAEPEVVEDVKDEAPLEAESKAPVAELEEPPVEVEALHEPALAVADDAAVAVEAVDAPQTAVVEPVAAVEAEDIASPAIEHEEQAPVDAQVEAVPTTAEDFAEAPVEVEAAIGEQVPLAEPEVVEEAKEEEVEAEAPAVELEAPPVEAEVKEEPALALVDDPAVAIESVPETVEEPIELVAAAEPEDTTSVPVVEHEEQAPVEAEVEAAPTAVEQFEAAPVEVEAAVGEQVPLAEPEVVEEVKDEALVEAQAETAMEPEKEVDAEQPALALADDPAIASEDPTIADQPPVVEELATEPESVLEASQSPAAVEESSAVEPEVVHIEETRSPVVHEEAAKDAGAEDGAHSHTEPIHDASSEAEDKLVDLPAVPVVEAEAAPPVEPTPLPEQTAGERVIDEDASATDILPPGLENVVSSGDTPGPQALLDSTKAEPASEEVKAVGTDHAEETRHDITTHTHEPVQES